MENSRKNFHKSIETLEKWRSVQESTNSLNLFHTYADSSISGTLSCEDFDEMRDFLVAEILLSNGQRTSVICVMKFSEVEKDGINSVTPQGYHRLMIAHHETGYVQRATIYLYPNIFNALHVFAHKVLSELRFDATKVNHTVF